MTSPDTSGSAVPASATTEAPVADLDASRDIADVPAVEIIGAAAVHLMSAAAVKCGLAPDADGVAGEDLKDLDEKDREAIRALMKRFKEKKGEG